MWVPRGVSLAALLSFAAGGELYGDILGPAGGARIAAAPEEINGNEPSISEPVPIYFLLNRDGEFPSKLEIFEGSECVGAPKTTCCAPDMNGILDCPDKKTRVLDLSAFSFSKVSMKLIEYSHTKSVDKYTSEFRKAIFGTLSPSYRLRPGIENLKDYCAAATDAIDTEASPGVKTQLNLGTLEIGQVKPLPNCGNDNDGYLTYFSETFLSCDTCASAAITDHTGQVFSYKLSCDPTFASVPDIFRAECPADYPIHTRMPFEYVDSKVRDDYFGTSGETLGGVVGIKFDTDERAGTIRFADGNMCCKANRKVVSILLQDLISEEFGYFWHFGRVGKSRSLQAKFSEQVAEFARTQYGLEVVPECIRNDACTVKNAILPDFDAVCREGIYATECYHSTIPDLPDYTPPANAFAPDCSDYTPPAPVAAPTCLAKDGDGNDDGDGDGAPNLGVTVALPVVGSLATAATIVYVGKKQKGV